MVEPYELRRGSYKNLTLRLIPPEGRLRVTAPWFLPQPVIDRFVADRADWIAEKRKTLPGTKKVDREVIWVWGQACRLKVDHPGKMPRVVVDPEKGVVHLRVPESWTLEQRQKTLDRAQAERVVQALNDLIPAWTTKTGLRVDRWRVKSLRSRWGSCRPDTRSLIFNSRLGAFPFECLEHVVAHEMAHLVHPDHSPRFHALVESWLPGAKRIRALLRRGPEGTETAGLDASQDSLATPEEGTGPEEPIQC